MPPYPRSQDQPVMVMSAITEHLIDRGDGTAVELFLAQPSAAKPAGALLFVHGYQRGLFSAEEKLLMTDRCSISHLA